MFKNNARFAIGAALSVALAASAAPAAAQEYGLGQAYAGGSITRTDFGAGNADNLGEEFGFQGFGGYNFGAILPAESLDIMAEGGFWVSDTPGRANNNNITGIWANGVVAHRINRRWSALGRLGFDFDDDDGLMYGAGVEYHVRNAYEGMKVRGELVERDATTSLQVSLVFHFPKRN